MSIAPYLLKLTNEYKDHAPAILAIVTGLGMILAKDYSGGLSEILQALTIIFGGASVVGLRHAVAGLAKPTGTDHPAESHS